MMFLVVTFVSLMVHIYSTGYMHGDVRFTYFFAALSLFTASMLFMVLADNLLQLMIGWELVGLCSFMLIGHWFEEKNNSSAALKAFFTTKFGDIGLMLGTAAFAQSPSSAAIVSAEMMCGSGCRVPKRFAKARAMRPTASPSIATPM